MSEVRNENIERKAVIFNVQKYNTFDGPGVRTLIFFRVARSDAMVFQSRGA